MRSPIYGYVSARHLLGAAAILLVTAARPVAAAERPAPSPEAQLRQRLQQSVGLTWAGLPLRPALESLAKSQSVTILLDRRIDPDQTVSLFIQQEPLELVLERIAERLKAGVCCFGPVVYFGPRSDAQRLRTLGALNHEALKPLPAAQRRKLDASRTWHWDDLATPRQLLDELTAESGIAIRGSDQIPHDLLAGADLPVLPWIDRLELVCVQFGLTFNISPDGRSVTLAPIPKEVTVRRSYPGGGRAEELARRWTRQLPEARVRVADDNVVVEGRVEDHEMIERALRTGRATRQTVGGGKQVYQLSVEGMPLAAILRNFEERLGYELRVNRPAIEKAGISLDQPVTVRVHDASLDALLQATLTPVGLTYRIDGRAIDILPITDAKEKDASPQKVKSKTDPP